jgi:hypothetical protein
MMDSERSTYGCWPYVAAVLSGLLWFAGGMLVAFMSLGERTPRDAPGSWYLSVLWLAPTFVLPFIVLVSTRRRAWVGMLTVLLSPVISYNLLWNVGGSISADWKKHQGEMAPKIVERHLPGVLPEGLVIDTAAYTAGPETALLVGTLNMSVSDLTQHIRSRLPKDWIEVRVKHYDDDIEPVYKEELRQKELAEPEFLSPLKGDWQSSIALTPDGNATMVEIRIGEAILRHGDLLWARRLNGVPMDRATLRRYSAQN